ncbi:MAG TPA: MFS transporter [Xanthobacteraceae bacterium]|nr:MFS transporter [Xanthobacteraceae bacterium]
MAQPFVDPCAKGVIDAEPCPREQGRELPSGRRRIILAACVVASSMAFIDGSVLTVALPKLRTALGADLATVQWVINSYVLALAALTLVGGALADTYGKARILQIGCFLFGAVSAGCALSSSVGGLIAARALQGIAAALLTPASLALIGATYPKEERAAAIGVWAAASALTSAAGPVLGGWLTQQFGWQAVFWINPPLAVIAIALLFKFAPADRPEARRFDIIGASIIACGLGALTWVLSQIGRGQSATASFASDTMLVTLSILGLVCIGGYAAWEPATDHPMTPPRLWRNRDFVGLNVATLLIYGGLSILFFLLPFDLIDRRGLSPTAAGSMFLPFTLAVGLLSPYFGALASKLGTRAMLVAGGMGASAAYVWMILAHDRALVLGVIGPQTMLGLSFAVLIAPLTAAVMSSVAQADQGLASGINNAASRIAQLAGVAVAAGLGALMAGYELGLAAAAVLSAAGALATALIRH